MTVYPRTWDPTHARAVLTTESRQKARELFLQTHRPFRRIRVDFCKEGGVEPFIDEERFRSIVQSGAPGDHNRLFFIVGEPGSGKSELCQWLEYTADRTCSLPVHVPRAATSAAHVAALLRRALGRSDAPALGRAPLDAQAAHIAHAAVVLLYELGGFDPVERWEALILSPEVRQAIRDHLAAAAAGVPSDLLSDTQGTMLCAQYSVPCDPAGLRRLLSGASEQALWLGDLRDLLGRLSESAARHGQRPLLLLEDITALQLLGDRLLDYLVDLSAGQLDAVIGITPGHERTQLAGATLSGDLTHIHQRLRARFALTDDDGRTFGFEEDLAEFARSYLVAIKREAAAYTQPFLNEALYPFTETALRRALAALREEGNPRQTPRLFIEHVLAPALAGDQVPPLALDRSPYLAPPPALFRADAVPDPTLESLLRWYGRIEDGYVVVDRDVADAWGVSVPTGLAVGAEIRAERTYLLRPAGVRDEDGSWEQQLRELQRWLSAGGLYPSRETLKRGIERVVLSLGDPRALGSPNSTAIDRAEIVYARGDERLPIVLGRESGDQPATEAYVKVRVAGISEERTLLEELAYLSLSGLPIWEICSNAAITLAWAQERWSEYHAEVRSLLTSRLGIAPERLILCAWRMVCGLTDVPWRTRPPIRATADAAPYEHLTPWLPERHGACHTAGAALVVWTDLIRRLFVGAFALRETQLDADRCRLMMDANIDADVRAIAAMPLRSLQTLPFKIRPGGQTLYHLLAPLQRYAQILNMLDIGTELHADNEMLDGMVAHLSVQTSDQLPELRSGLEQLRWRCGDLGMAWRERWDVDLSTLTMLGVDDIAELTALSISLRDTVRQQRETITNVWAYIELRCSLRPLLQHPYWRGVETLREVQASLRSAAQARYRAGIRQPAGIADHRSALREASLLWKELHNA